VEDGDLPRLSALREEGGGGRQRVGMPRPRPSREHPGAEPAAAETGRRPEVVADQVADDLDRVVVGELGGEGVGGRLRAPVVARGARDARVRAEQIPGPPADGGAHLAGCEVVRH
jgi:hypothetical protein